jgi:hypothetical protein
MNRETLSPAVWINPLKPSQVCIGVAVFDRDGVEVRRVASSVMGLRDYKTVNYSAWHLIKSCHRGELIETRTMTCHYSERVYRAMYAPHARALERKESMARASV